MILLTGATGFIGSNLLDALVEEEHRVRALVRKPAQTDEVDGPNVEAYLGDVTDTGSLEGAAEGVDQVVHLAAVIRPPSRYEPVNVGGTRNLVDAAVTADVDRFVHMSIVGADPEADHPYPRTRGQAEEIVEASGLDATIVRSSLVYGPGDHVVSTIAELSQGPVTPIPGDGSTRIQPIHVDDVVDVLTRVVDDPPTARTIELGGPDVVTYKELVQNVVDRVNPRSRVHHVPKALAKIGAWVLWKRGVETSPAEVDLLSVGDNVPASNDAPDLLDDDLCGIDVGLGYLGSVGPYGEPDGVI